MKTDFPVIVLFRCVFVLAAALPVTASGADASKLDPAKVEAERAKRQTPIVEVAPAPLPTGIPLIVSGKDDKGNPRREVDEAALRSLLWHKRYSDLTRYIEQFQTEFEADPAKEYWPASARHAFTSAESQLRPQLDAWVAATPKSFAPYLARGSYLISIAQARRGSRWIQETPAADLAAMDEALKEAMADLDRALQLRPKLVTAMAAKINGLRLHKNSPIRQVFQQAIAVCPSCFAVRAVYMYTLTPRWGGSYEAMAQFAKEHSDHPNPRMRLLSGFIDYDKAEMLRIEKKPKEALAAIQRACALGEYWSFLFERAQIKDHLRDKEGALQDLDRAIALAPNSADILVYRASVHQRLGQREAAGRDLLAGVRLDPTNQLARRLLERTLYELKSDGWTHYQAGRRDDALRLYDLAVELAPTDKDVQYRRAHIVTAKPGGGSESIATLEERARNSPDDFRAIQQLDYALTRQHEFSKIVEIWTAYLKRNPKNAAAYLERGGAYFHMKRWDEAHDDARKACELGNNEGCTRATQIRTTLRR